jgi:outer membrane lipoprotein carrier protein
MGKTGRVKKTVLLVLSLLIMASGTSADLLDDLKVRQTRIKSVSATFTQEKKTKLLSKPINSDGKFFYKHPDRIRWEYSGGTNMQVIFNGKDLWIYYPDLKEADKLSGLSQYASMMRFDVLSLSKDYTITAKKDKSIALLTFVPKTKGPLSRIEMEIVDDSSFPRMVKLTDQNNEPTTITFRDVKLNTDIRDSSFTFMPDKGVVVRERSLP